MVEIRSEHFTRGKWKVKCLENIKNRLHKIFYQNSRGVKMEVMKREMSLNTYQLFIQNLLLLQLTKQLLMLVCSAKNSILKIYLWSVVFGRGK